MKYTPKMLDLSDRSQCFYWQTDRKLTAKEYEQYFLKRHEVSKSELEDCLRRGIQSIQPIEQLEIIDPDENVLRGNVNIVRKVRINGREYIARIHPQGIKNGYFYAEREALNAAQSAGLPVPQILEVHEAESETDRDFVLMSVSPGVTLEHTIRDQPEKEILLLEQAGKRLAQLHEIRVEKFGPFDNNQAKTNRRLVGLHESYRSFIHAGLQENIQRLLSFEVITPEQAQQFLTVFKETNFEPTDGPRLVHNDYADWNLLSDGEDITAMLDWDECHGGDPVADLACWSTFYDMERYAHFLRGYESVASLPDDYENRFHFYRLRYTVSKMALRIKRYQVDPSDFMKEKIRVGTLALVEETQWLETNTR